jgi:CelD/BcsL family acetyltransferase involved in cellulose biosynthesis
MAVDWTREPAAFADPEWSALADADPEATLFHTPRFLKPYWEELSAGESLEVATARPAAAADAAAVAAFAVTGDRLTWLGGFDVTDYMGPVGSPEHRDQAAADLMGAVAARDDWRHADLAGLPEDGRWLPALVEGARRARLPVRVELDGVAPAVRLPSSFDEYLAGLPAKLRHEIRRKDRRLRAAHPDARVVDSRPETVAEDLDRFVALHRASAGAKGRFMVPGMELFFRRLADELTEDGTLRLAFLEAGGDRIAAAMGFRFRDRFLLYNSAYDHGLSRLAPGMVLVAELIRDAIEEDRSVLDMLKGDLGYKYRFGARPRRVCRLLIDRD